MCVRVSVSLCMRMRVYTSQSDVYTHYIQLRSDSKRFEL